MAWLANVPRCLMGMEAACGAHHSARRLSALGHDVRLLPAQDVRPLVKTNKHDQADAAAIAEAVQRAQMRFVPIKSAARLEAQRQDPNGSARRLAARRRGRAHPSVATVALAAKLTRWAWAVLARNAGAFGRPAPEPTRRADTVAPRLVCGRCTAWLQPSRGVARA